jgi:hypothetical protein
MSEENKQEEVVQSEEKKEVEVEGKAVDRPEINYQRELERKNAALERARQELEAERAKGGNKRDANDISTWSDHELKLLLNDKNAAGYHEQANDILLERKVKRIRENERIQERRTLADIELRTKYPEALDPTSELSVRMEQLVYDLDLQKSPAGRLAAAKIAASELGLTNKKSTAQERKAEADRIARVKGQMTDGDRSKAVESENSPKEVEKIEKRISSEKLTESDGVAAALKLKGMDRKAFFGR